MSVELAESVWERVTKWGKIYVALLLVPLGILVAFVWGRYSNLSEIIGSAETKAINAQEQAAAAEDKASKLNAQIDDSLKRVGEFEKRMKTYGDRVSQTADLALNEVGTMKEKGMTALAEISQLRDAMNKQQKELAETGALVKELASRSVIEGFQRGGTPDSYQVLTHATRKNSVYIRLKRAPYPQTLRLQWNTAVQPPDSYVVQLNNIVLLNWADTAARLSERRLFVTYIADPSVPEASLVKQLTVQNGRVYADKTPLVYIGALDLERTTDPDKQNENK